MNIKRIKVVTTGIVAFLMVLMCFFSLMLFSSSASSTAPSASVRKTDYKTTERKPTYTATLNENNKLLKNLEEKLNGENGKKENKFLSFTKDYGKDIIDETTSMISLLKKSFQGKEADWEQFGVDLVKNIIVAIAASYGLGGVVDSVFNGLEVAFAKGEVPLSEIDILTDNINKQFNQMSDQLYDIEDQISSLSNSVQKATVDILAGTSSQIENLDAKQILRTFMSSVEGNFSYTRFHNYIYGSTKNGNQNKANAFYNHLIEAIVFGADNETIKYYYDKLFYVLESEMDMFSEYYFGNTTGLDKSIAKYYYDYLSANSSLVTSGKTAESMAIEFAYDLYSTYVFSYEIKKLCYSYQITEMYIEESLNGKELGMNSKYQYNSDSFSSYTDIMSDLEDIETYIEQAEDAIVGDIAYILGMGNSYTVVDKNGNIHEIAKYYDTYGNIANGQTIYLNKFSDSINSIFELDTDKFSYYVNGVKIIDTKKQGIINTDDVSNQFTASVKYGDKELYSIEFSKEVTDTFSGGSGSYDDPYLISNEYQFFNIKNELNACYELIADLQFDGYTITPIGTYKKPFNGILNGNGYSISHLTINSLVYDNKNIMLTPTTGLFGTIGNNGIVENLTIEGISVVSDYNIDGVNPESDTSAYYIGTIAGYNNGVIYNCTITENSSITVHRNKQIQDSRNVEIYVGGIAGINNKNISYCTVDSMQIEADSMLQMYAESPKINKNSLYVGGITATTMGIVSYCRVNNSVKLSAYAKSTANTEDKVKPYVIVKTGGIVANENDYTRLLSVFSDVEIIKCRGEVYNAGRHWILGHRYDYSNVTIKSGTYYPVYFWISTGDNLDIVEQAIYNSKYDDLFYKAIKRYNREHRTAYSYNNLPSAVQIELDAEAQKETKQYLISEYEKAKTAAIANFKSKIIENYNDPIFSVSTIEYEVKIKYECNQENDKCSCGCVLENNKCVCTPENDLIYEINTQALQKKHMVFYVNDEKVNAEIINYYGFDTYNETTNIIANAIKIFFITNISGEDILLSGDLNVSIREDRIIGDPVISGIKKEYEINSDNETGLAELFETGFTISYYYASGKIDYYYINSDNRNSVKVYGFDTSSCIDGEFTFTILHNGNSIEQTAKVICYHRSVSHTSDVPATCQLLGYEVWTCNDCGKKIYKNYVTGDHHYVVEDGTAATCIESGHTQRVLCDICGIVFEEGEWIQILEHDYISIEQAKLNGIKIDNSYSAVNYHYCINGQHYEPHQYFVTESTNEIGKMVYTYICLECGYSYDEIDENLITNDQGKMPTVFVTDGYVLETGDEVTVYVQLLNNPGFNGANFGIRYSDGLELISAEEGTIIPNALSVRNEVYNGFNCLWAKKDKESWTEDGYILKLVFKVTSEDRINQIVDVVYGSQKITYSNGKIDEVEGGFATTSTKYGVQKFITHSGTISFVNHLPGDVNEDNVVDITDAMYIAWGIVGKQGISYKKQYADVNLDGKVDVYDVIWILQSISGNYGINLLNYEYKLELNLNGFDTDAFEKLLTVYFYDEDGKINNWNTNISFSEYENEMNRKGYTFVGWYTRLVGGEEVDTTKNIVYDHQLGIQTLYAHWVKNSITFDMNGATSNQYDTIEYQSNNYLITLPIPELKYNIDYYVSGYDGIYKSGMIYKTFIGWYLNGEKVTQIDLSTANFGNAVLIAKWSTEYTWNLPIESRQGYNNITSWYWKQQFDSEYLIGTTMDDDIVEKLTTTGNGNKVIYGQPNYITYTINYENLKTASNINSNHFRVIDTVKLNPLSTLYGYTFEGWYLNDIKYDTLTPSDYYNLIGNDNTVTLTAKWKAVSIALSIKGITSDSDYSLVEIAKIYYCYGNDDYKNVAGYYNDKEFTNSIKTISNIKFYNIYNNFIIKGIFDGVTDNGHSYAKYNGNTYFDENGNPNLFNVTEGAIFAYCCPKKYTITFNVNAPKYGITNTSGCKKSIDTYFNENLDDIIMPTNTYFKAKYCYNGVDFYDFNGKSDDKFTFTSNVTFIADWSTKVDNYKNYTYITSEKTAYSITLNQIGSTGNYLLIEDITLNKNWIPISKFSGTLDGNNYVISNLRIDISTSGTNDVYGGFICINNGTIRNISFNSLYVHYSGKQPYNVYVGGVVGLNNGTISNCQVLNGDILGDTGTTDTAHNFVSMTGGICGVNSGLVSNCTVKASIIKGLANSKKNGCYVYVGGVAGKNNRKITSCQNNNGNRITAQAGGTDKCTVYNSVGGIVGNNGPTGEVSSCTATPDNLETPRTSHKGKTAKGYGNDAHGDIIGHQE